MSDEKKQQQQQQKQSSIIAEVGRSEDYDCVTINLT